MESLESDFMFTIPSKVDNKYLDYHKNFSLLISDFYDDISDDADDDYEEFLADIWVGIVLTLMVLFCVCCMCSCLLYHKFQQWKRSVDDHRRENLEAGYPDSESLPSYTIVSGLPSYEEALEQLKTVKKMNKPNAAENDDSPASVSASPIKRLSVIELFQLYKNATPETSNKT